MQSPKHDVIVHECIFYVISTNRETLSVAISVMLTPSERRLLFEILVLIELFKTYCATRLVENNDSSVVPYEKVTFSNLAISSFWWFICSWAYFKSVRVYACLYKLWHDHQLNLLGKNTNTKTAMICYHLHTNWKLFLGICHRIHFKGNHLRGRVQKVKLQVGNIFFFRWRKGEKI